MPAVPTIVRVWRGTTQPQHADGYQAHVETAVFPRLAAIAGFLGGRILRRSTEKDVEFIVMTEWTSWEAIKAFAGGDPHIAVIDPAARALLASADAHVRHFELAYPLSSA